MFSITFKPAKRVMWNESFKRKNIFCLAFHVFLIKLFLLGWSHLLTQQLQFPVTSMWPLTWCTVALIWSLFYSLFIKTVESDSRFSQLAVMFTHRCFLFLPRLLTAVSLLLISRRGFASTFKADTRHVFLSKQF